MKSPDKLSLLWPPHWLRLLGSSSDFTANPVLGSSALNRRGLHVLRKRLAHAICALRRRFMAAGLPAGARQALSQQGFVRIDDFLPAAELAAIRAELSQAALPVIEMAQPPALTRRINLDARSCEGRFPALHRLITCKPLLAMVRYAAGYPGVPIIAIQCIHSASAEAGPGHDPQTDWHVDTFHSTAKAWLFLHDVGPQDGPLSYIPASHLPSRARLEWERHKSVDAARDANRMHAKGSLRATEAELQAIGYGDPFVAAVKANTLVVADTGGFHRRTPSPRPTTRVEVYLSLRRNPFFAGLVPGLMDLPLVRSRWAAWSFAWYERLHKQGRPGWIPSPRAGLRDDEISALGGP